MIAFHRSAEVWRTGTHGFFCPRSVFGKSVIGGNSNKNCVCTGKIEFFKLFAIIDNNSWILFCFESGFRGPDKNGMTAEVK